MKRILPALAITLSLSATCHANSYDACSTSGCSVAGSTSTTSSYTHTKYPLVLAHGMGGFVSLGPVDYFYGIPQNLASGGANVYITQVASFDNSTVRGEQLLSQVEEIAAISGSPKVNLIAHSQGVLDARYVAAVAPNLVASVTGVGGPNTGSPVADDVMSVSGVVGPTTSSFIAGIVNGFFGIIDAISGKGYEQDSLAGLAQLTSANMALFNAAYPAGIPGAANPCGQGAASVNGVRYYSWGGTGVLTNPLDISDAALAATSLAFSLKPNDGLVGQCSSHLGVVIRDNYFMNHFDEVNQLFGLTSIFETSPVSLFRSQANRLKLAGL